MNDPYQKKLWHIRGDRHVPLYQQIQDLIMDHLQSGRLKPGDLLPSYPWLSRQLGVADKTVRQAYDVLRQAGILEIKRGKGTSIALQAGTGGTAGTLTGVLGILTPKFSGVVRDERLWHVQRTIQETFTQQRMDALLLAPTADLGTGSIADRFRSLRPDGIVVLGDVAGSILDRLRALRFPLIQVEAYASQSTVDQIGFDYESAARNVTYDLIGKGYRRIAFVRAASSSPGEACERGFRHALGSAQMAVPPACIVSIALELGDRGYSKLSELLNEGIDAVFAEHLLLAETVLRCLRARNPKAPPEPELATLVYSSELERRDPVISGLAFNLRTLAAQVWRRLQELRVDPGAHPLSEWIPAESFEACEVSI